MIAYGEVVMERHHSEPYDHDREGTILIAALGDMKIEFSSSKPIVSSQLCKISTRFCYCWPGFNRLLNCFVIKTRGASVAPLGL